LQVLEVRGAGADHPFLAHVPESRYLKAVFCRVW
jgi:23S rRNA (cytosine1962-C5)-methyltransferase